MRRFLVWHKCAHIRCHLECIFKNVFLTWFLWFARGTQRSWQMQKIWHYHWYDTLIICIKEMRTESTNDDCSHFTPVTSTFHFQHFLNHITWCELFRRYEAMDSLLQSSLAYSKSGEWHFFLETAYASALNLVNVRQRRPFAPPDTRHTHTAHNIIRIWSNWSQTASSLKNNFEPGN